MNRMETQLAQAKASRKAVGSNIGAGKFFHHGIFVKKLLTVILCLLFAFNHG